MKYTFLEKKYNNKFNKSKFFEYDQFDDEENDEENIDDNFQKDYNKYNDNLYNRHIVKIWC